MLFNLHGVLHHPFAGTLKAYRPTSINNLMYWNIICDACERGLKRFDMGRSTVGSGTYRYKKSWGATEQALFYHYFLRPGVKPPTLDTSWVQLATAAWKHLPLALTSRLGPSLIRHIL